MYCFPKSRINENGGRNSKLFAILTAVKMIVFIVKVVMFIFIKIPIHCHTVIDQFLKGVMNEDQMLVLHKQVGTSQTGLDLLLVSFIRRPQLCVKGVPHCFSVTTFISQVLSV